MNDGYEASTAGILFIYIYSSKFSKNSTLCSKKVVPSDKKYRIPLELKHIHFEDFSPE